MRRRWERMIGKERSGESMKKGWQGGQDGRREDGDGVAPVSAPRCASDSEHLR